MFFFQMGTPQRDITVDYAKAQKELLIEKHCAFLIGYGRSHNTYEYGVTDYLRMSGIYWLCTCIDLLHSLKLIDQDYVIDYIQKCHDKNSGGYSPSPNHDPHLLYTLSAVQVLVQLNRIDLIDKQSLCLYIKQLQQEDGSFIGDQWGEIDTRFSFCAVACLKLIDSLDVIDIDRATNFVMSCLNFDGGFGCIPGAESHAGQIYCCLGFLSLVQRLDNLDLSTRNMLAWWLCERQLDKSGGLNGRPEKLPDVCYSWWVLASLKILGKIQWINSEKLSQFILAAQDDETGGCADRPGNVPDPFHTLFGVTGLSLLNIYDENIIKKVNPVLCMPEYVIQKAGIKMQLL
jgi:geranylgeranyl transferase type-2 subunit beta